MPQRSKKWILLRQNLQAVGKGKTNLLFRERPRRHLSARLSGSAHALGRMSFASLEDVRGAFYRRAEGAVFAEHTALLVQSPGRGKLLRLKGTARRIWQLLEYPVTPEELCSRLEGEFAGSREKIFAEVKQFLDDLQANGLAEKREHALAPIDAQRQRYLWLLKRALVNLIYPEHELRIRFLETAQTPGESDKLEPQRFLRDIRYRQPDRFAALVAAKENGTSLRFPHTMIGLSGLDHLERCAEQIFADRIPGDFSRRASAPGVRPSFCAPCKSHSVNRLGGCGRRIRSKSCHRQKPSQMCGTN